MVSSARDVQYAFEDFSTGKIFTYFSRFFEDPPAKVEPQPVELQQSVMPAIEEEKLYCSNEDYFGGQSIDPAYLYTPYYSFPDTAVVANEGMKNDSDDLKKVTKQTTFSSWFKVSTWGNMCPPTLDGSSSACLMMLRARDRQLNGGYQAAPLDE